MSTRKHIYLDYAATAPPDGRVLDAMLPYLKEFYGNPSSVHGPGRRARHAVEEARERIAHVLHVDAGEVLFTGGGTEADNTALRTMLEAEAPSYLVTGDAEHEAIRRTAAHLSTCGVRVVRLSPDGAGAVPVASVEAALDGTNPLVSLMHVNNETGAVNQIRDISKCVRARQGLLHTDAVQSAAGYRLSEIVPFIDMMTLSAHKIGGPKGVGMLFVRSGTSVGKVLHGGAQERNRRAGTENVAGIVGLAAALEFAQSDPEKTASEVRIKRNELADGLKEALDDRIVFTTPRASGQSAPHILHALFRDDKGGGLDGEMLILGLDMDGISVSSGAACSSGAIEPSHVLSAIKVAPRLARSAIRFSLGQAVTLEEIGLVIESVVRVVKRVGNGH